MQETKDAAGGLSALSLKLIAIAAMVIDHAAWYFVPAQSTLGFIMNFVGKLTLPIMAFLIAESYRKTRSVKRYVLRLFVFALISHIPYAWFLGWGDYSYSSVITTLLLGLLALWAWDSKSLPAPVRVLLPALCVALSFRCDWGYFGVLFVLGFGMLGGQRKKQMALYAALSVADVIYVALLTTGSLTYYALPSLGLLMAIPLLLLYNGRRGPGGAVAKWGFYVFYPLQFIVIKLIYLALS